MAQLRKSYTDKKVPCCRRLNSGYKRDRVGSKYLYTSNYIITHSVVVFNHIDYLDTEVLRRNLASAFPRGYMIATNKPARGLRRPPNTNGSEPPKAWRE